MLSGLHVSQGVVYQKNIGILKEYTDDYFKLIHMRALRQAGFEESSAIKNKKNSASNTEKLAQSLSRSRATVFELAICNQWDYFVTLTIDGQKYDRSNLRIYMKSFSKWLNNYNYQNQSDIRYLLIPENHQDGSWHMHGLLSAVPLSDLKLFTLQDHLPYRLRKKISSGRSIYDWPRYRSAFGWSVAEPIMSKEACAKYITKYITKSLAESRIALNHHPFYCSQGLNRAKEIYRAEIKRMFNPDYANDYVAVKRYRSAAEAALCFCDFEEDEAV